MKTLTMDLLYREVKTGLKAGEVILDVREAEEFKDGHIPGSRNFPLSTLESRVDEIKRFSVVYIHCHAGGRAQRAAALLKSKGVANLVCVSDGGYGNWKAAGYPVEKT